MIIAITGTPGVGKTTVSRIVKEKLEGCLISINELVEKEHLYNGIDAEKGYKIVDLEALFNKLDVLTRKMSKYNNIIIEGHLSHLYKNSDIVVALRAHPDILRKRMEIKNWDESKISENIEAEIIGVCSYEAYEIHGEKANELDTSNISPQEVSELLVEIINSNKKFPVGSVDFLDYLKSI